MAQQLQREKIRRDLERAQDKRTKTKEKISDLKARLKRQDRKVERLQTALEVFDEYSASPEMVGEDDSDQFLADDDYSISEAAKIVLERAGEPMRNSEIAEALIKHGFSYDKPLEKLRRSVTGVLSREDHFERVERGVYELQENESEDDLDDMFGTPNIENEETPSSAATE